MNERFINRLVLGYLNDLRGIPQKLEEVSEYVRGRVRRPAGAEVERALTTLEAAGYIEQAQVVAADPPMWKITADGIRQIEKLVPTEKLDPLIHGGAG
jgi:hypothetical protein